MEFCISIGNIGKHIIFPLIACLILILEYSLFHNKFKNINSHIIIFMITQSLGECLSIIPYFIQKRMNKNIRKDTLGKDNKLLYRKDYYEKYKNITLKKYGFLLINNILLFTFDFLFFDIFIQSSDISFWILGIILITLFSHLILKEEIHKHHYLSITTIVILGIILDLINFYGKVRFDFISLIIYILRDIIFSLIIVLKKYILEYLFCSVYEILLCEGIFNSIAFIIVLSIYTNKPNSNRCDVKHNNICYIDNFFSYYDSLDWKELLIFFFVMTYYLFYFLFALLTIKYFNAFYFVIILLSVEKIIYNFDIEVWKICLNLIIFTFVIFMTLVFLEIIELNCFGLQKNTKRNINKRAKLDGLIKIDLESIKNDKDKDKDKDNDLDDSLLYI